LIKIKWFSFILLFFYKKIKITRAFCIKKEQFRKPLLKSLPFDTLTLSPNYLIQSIFNIISNNLRTKSSYIV